jgi:nucleoside-diphosphate-sugar epimerase
MINVSVFGSTGFIGSNFANANSELVDRVDRDKPNPKYDQILYAIGTTDNYNVFENPKLDIETNLIKLIDDLELLRLSALIPKAPRTTTATIANTRCAQWIVCKATGVIDSP